MRIDVLTGEWERFEAAEGCPYHFALVDVVDLWRERGHEVRIVRGLPGPGWDRGDVCVLHVDLTHTPSEFASLARSYPVAVNGRFLDNSKRVVSANLVHPGDGYAGPVVVKSDLNYGGSPEAVLQRRRSGWVAKRVASARRRLPWTLRPQLAAKDYRLYDRRADVPRSVWWNRNFVVERYFEEWAEGMFWVRSWVFLGDRGFVRFQGADQRLFKAESVKVRRNHPDTDPTVLPDAVRRRRVELGMDFGKIDFIVQDGVAAVIDANRTPNSRAVTPEGRRDEASRVIDGLDALLQGPGRLAESPGAPPETERATGSLPCKQA